VTLIPDFFEDLDGRWGPPTGAKIPLRIIGSSALMLQTGYERGTKDSDVLETAAITVAVKARLLALGGEGTDLHRRHRLYVEVVGNGIPFLPQQALYHPQAELNARLRSFDLEVLDVVDVVVSKLKRFHADDRGDIEAMVDLEFVPHARLVARFREAVDIFLGDARAADLPRYWRNLNTVERDFLRAPETEVDLPEYIDR
jgi:hypothetical protein